MTTSSKDCLLEEILGSDLCTERRRSSSAELVLSGAMVESIIFFTGDRGAREKTLSPTTGRQRWSRVAGVPESLEILQP